MEKLKALNAIERRAFAVRLPLHIVCKGAKVGYSTYRRWKRDPNTVTAGPLKRLEDHLTALEREKAK